MNESQKIYADEPVRNAFAKISVNPDTLTLFVFSREGRLKGTLTDGDIRRGFMKGYGLDDEAGLFAFTAFSYITSGRINPREIREMKLRGVKLLPVLEEDGTIVRIIDFSKTRTILPFDAVLMAGGRGDRLRPLTDNIPKPMLEVGGKPLIEMNIDRVVTYGVTRFHISTGYLGEKISEYLGDGSSKGISIGYYRESTPLGTIGALAMFGNLVNDVVMLMNADLFTNIDFEDFWMDFVESGAGMAVATVPYNVDIPFAVVEEGPGDIITGLTEKPGFTWYANAGIYLIRRDLIELIAHGERLDATEFILRVIEKGYSVRKYPLPGFWIDIGRPEDYRRVIDFARHINYI
jgi:dTDP-glucose pyrophosphorylase